MITVKTVNNSVIWFFDDEQSVFVGEIDGVDVIVFGRFSSHDRGIGE